MGGRGSKRKAEDMLAERGGRIGIGTGQLEEGVKTSSGSGGRGAPGGPSPGSSRNTGDAYSGTGPVRKAPRWWEQEVEEEEPEQLSSESGFEMEVREEHLDMDGAPSTSPAGRSDPFAKVPEVVIRDHLLPLLEDPKDRLNLARAYPSVAKLLGGSKMTSLYFCSVFPLPNFLGLLPLKEFLRLREVSKDWKKSIDNGLEVRVNPPEPNYRSYLSIHTSSGTLALGFGGRHKFWLVPRIQLCIGTWPGSDRLEKLVSEIRVGNASVTPFVLKQASLWISSEMRAEDDDPYWDRSLTVLRKFGMDVRFLHSHCLSPSDMTGFPKYLEQLPLLTGIQFGLLNLDDEEAPPPVLLPPLPNLTFLRIMALKVSLFQPFVAYFDQLVSLDVQEAFGFMEWLDPGSHSTFPTLKHLAIRITDWEQLRKLQSLTSPLKDVNIYCHPGDRGASNICTSVHLYFVGHFKETLSSIKINQDFDCTEPLRTLETFGLPEQARIDLPQLKIFSFTIKECGYGPVNHLLKLTHPPEYLEVCVKKCLNGRQRNRGNEVLQIHDRFLKQMYTSNVWTLLPPLKEVKVCDYVSWKEAHYTRFQYEKKQEDKGFLYTHLSFLFN